ncbi:BURP domain-containing protein 2 [Artemisia annua]|uniref:BURP domain-containing protein 2 n=1 Tax=Artemisia annua TaxID=35608 RepID=A0A2U1P8Z1_ARTAN|nr:BURP domain-containing protein 2 [Artemisia annua]
MCQGKSLNLRTGRDVSSLPPFVSHQMANTLPFASDKLQDIYESFKVNPDSLEAKLIKKTIITFKLGKKVKAISTQVIGDKSNPLQKYKVDKVEKLNGDNVVVCHQEYYAYAVHLCHKSPKINAYTVSLVCENNVQAKAISVCHEDTASWNPLSVIFLSKMM